jgi:hypothetical protein
MDNGNPALNSSLNITTAARSKQSLQLIPRMPQRQPKKYGFRILPDYPVDFDSLPILEK